MLASGEQRIERRLLQRRADHLPDSGPFPHDVETADTCRACGRGQQRREHVHGRRLASAVRAEEAIDLTRVDRQVDPVNGTRALLELPYQVIGLDRVLAHRSRV